MVIGEQVDLTLEQLERLVAEVAQLACAYAERGSIPQADTGDLPLPVGDHEVRYAFAYTAAWRVSPVRQELGLPFVPG